jgi:hypothetical protein
LKLKRGWRGRRTAPDWRQNDMGDDRCRVDNTTDPFSEANPHEVDQTDLFLAASRDSDRFHYPSEIESGSETNYPPTIAF